MTLAALLAAAQREESPWWGDPVIAGIFLLLGGLLGFGGSWFTKRKELERQDYARWDNTILEAALQILRTSEVMAYAGAEGHRYYVADIKERGALYKKSLDELTPLVARLELIASPKISATAMDVLMAAVAMTAHRAFVDLNEQLGTEIPTLPQAMNEFRQVVRDELRAKK